MATFAWNGWQLWRGISGSLALEYAGRASEIFCIRQIAKLMQTTQRLSYIMALSEVWVFSGVGSRFTSGVFTEKEMAIAWIKEHKLSGALTRYPLDVGVYEWAIDHELFKPTKDHETSAEFIQQFTSASQEHYHFEGGKSDQI